MNLAIDIGNSFTHLAIFRNNRCVFNSKYITSDMISIRKILFSTSKKFKITQIGISSVYPEKEKSVSAYIKKNTKLLPLIINNNSRLPLNIKVKSPETLGADRICNAVFAYSYFKGKENVLIVDLGTANTLDVINKKGEFIGGIIAPGIMTSSKALFENTRKLPLLTYSKLSPDASIIGTDTLTAIQSGLVNYMKFAIERFVEVIKKRFKGDLKVIVTGGSSQFLHGKVNFKYKYFENTVLEGINIILNFQNS